MTKRKIPDLFDDGARLQFNKAELMHARELRAEGDLTDVTFISTGQSNSEGNKDGVGGDQTTNHNFDVWSEAPGQFWNTATLGESPYWQPEKPGDPVTNNIFWNLGKRIQEFTTGTVQQIHSGLGATPISEWKPYEGQQWFDLERNVEAAFASNRMQEMGKTHADFFAFFQGESDGLWNTHYRADFLEFRRAVIAEGWVDRDTPWLVGETIVEGVANQTFRELEADGKHTWLHLADNDGYETAQPHFTGQGCVDYGRGSFFQEWISAL